MTGTTTAAAEPLTDYPATAGRVGSGPGEAFVHLVLDLGEGRWATVCPADAAGDGVGRNVGPTLAPVDCPLCLADHADLAVAVNREVAAVLAAEEGARALLARFFDWAAAEYPHGGAVLAVYAGDTRLHPTTVDERRRVVDAYLATERRFPVVE